MKWVAIADAIVSEINEKGRRLFVNKAMTIGDVVAINLNSSSVGPDGEPRKELRLYALPPNPMKTPPRFHLGTEVRGEIVFEFTDFAPLFLYTNQPEIEFFRLRHLLNAEQVEIVEVFNEFDKQIFRLHKEKRVDMDAMDADELYEKAAKCKARLISTTFPFEAEICYVKAVQLMGKIIGMEVNKDGKVAC